MDKVRFGIHRRACMVPRGAPWCHRFLSSIRVALIVYCLSVYTTFSQHVPDPPLLLGTLPSAAPRMAFSDAYMCLANVTAIYAAFPVAQTI